MVELVRWNAHVVEQLRASCFSPTAQAGEVEVTEVVLIVALSQGPSSKPSQCPPGDIQVMRDEKLANSIQEWT